ncbi:TraR/DksA family transcriptional regulator [Ferrimonas balearica]|uniref:TraR/DksA family transcriptional regulator n=1 Tax=Ferrimonas balearica TaxID=44012 RepID=UPI001C98F33C|nr:TraR/DksA family transcriptional regulator [Ferrimonas balearica]MBY5991849.1 TraR/DksA family transcriptional regulator [Ferrimonas balearica]
MNQDTGLSEATLKELKRALLKRRATVQESLDELLADLKGRAPCYADAAERGFYETQRAMTERRIAQEQANLARIERALAKMAEGRYGICERSGEPISLERLRVLPEAEHDQ